MAFCQSCGIDIGTGGVHHSGGALTCTACGSKRSASSKHSAIRLWLLSSTAAAVATSVFLTMRDHSAWQTIIRNMPRVDGFSYPEFSWVGVFASYYVMSLVFWVLTIGLFLVIHKNLSQQAP